MFQSFIPIIKQSHDVKETLKLAVTGGVHAGKTTRAADWVKVFHENGLRCVGCLERAVFDSDGVRLGYDFEDIVTGERKSFARRTESGNGQWKYVFNDQIWPWYESVYQQDLSPDIVVFDELGLLEARGEGIMPYVEGYLSENSGISAILCVCRGSVMNEISERLGGFDCIEFWN